MTVKCSKLRITGVYFRHFIITKNANYRADITLFPSFKCSSQCSFLLNLFLPHSLLPSNFMSPYCFEWLQAEKDISVLPQVFPVCHCSKMCLPVERARQVFLALLLLRPSAFSQRFIFLTNHLTDEKATMANTDDHDLPGLGFLSCSLSVVVYCSVSRGGYRPSHVQVFPQGRGSGSCFNEPLDLGGRPWPAPPPPRPPPPPLPPHTIC
jgi:hypothetical protein